MNYRKNYVNFFDNSKRLVTNSESDSDKSDLRRSRLLNPGIMQYPFAFNCKSLSEKLLFQNELRPKIEIVALLEFQNREEKV